MSINTNNFYMVPKELFQTDLSLSELFLYSRMLDDSEFYIKKYGKYSPSHARLAAYLQSNRTDTASKVIDKLIDKGLVVNTGKKTGGRCNYIVIDYKTLPELITKLPIAERTKKKNDSTSITESVIDEGLQPIVESSPITESVSDNSTNYGNRNSPITETVDMSNYNNHTFNINHTDKKERDTEIKSDNIGIPDHKPQSKNNDLSQCTNQQSITQCLTDSNPLSQCFTSSDSAYQYLVDNGCIVDRSTFNSTFNIRGTYVCPKTGLYVRRSYS